MKEANFDLPLEPLAKEKDSSTNLLDDGEDIPQWQKEQARQTQLRNEATEFVRDAFICEKLSLCSVDRSNSCIFFIRADLVFMLVYTISTSRGLNDSDTYYLGGKLKRILVDRPLSSDGPPKAAKTFKTIRRVEEFHQWLQGPFMDAIFSGKTLDGGQKACTFFLYPSALTFEGDESFWNQGGEKEGFILGYNRIIGAVRIAQLRTKVQDCPYLPPALQRIGVTQMDCYGFVICL